MFKRYWSGNRNIKGAGGELCRWPEAQFILALFSNEKFLANELQIL